MLKRNPTKIALNRDTLRKLNKGELSQVKGGKYNSSYEICNCSSSDGAGGFGPSHCILSCF